MRINKIMAVMAASALVLGACSKQYDKPEPVDAVAIEDNATEAAESIERAREFTPIGRSHSYIVEEDGIYFYQDTLDNLVSAAYAGTDQDGTEIVFISDSASKGGFNGCVLHEKGSAFVVVTEGIDWSPRPVINSSGEAKYLKYHCYKTGQRMLLDGDTVAASIMRDAINGQLESQESLFVSEKASAIDR